MTFAEAAAAFQIAQSNLAASPDDNAVWAAYCAATTDLDAAKAIRDAEFRAAVAAKEKPATKSRRASGGRVIHTVGRKSWTEY